MNQHLCQGTFLPKNPLRVNFTFSAKERDVETGLSYFGSRYYSSDLSIWLSVDPQSDKYPSFSPYTYCANNPIKLVDPNGEEIDIDGYRYIPGQSCPEGVADNTRNKWNAMNDIYKRENGKCVIDEMDQSKSCFTISSEIKTDGRGCYSSNNDGSGGTIYLNGHDNDIGTLSHELFHGYQDLNGIEQHSIFNEVEANLFSFSITGDTRGLFDKIDNDEYSRNYNTAMATLLYGNGLDAYSFNHVLSNFKDCSPKNWKGTYDNYSINSFSISLISDFYPLYPVRLQK